MCIIRTFGRQPSAQGATRLVNRQSDEPLVIRSHNFLVILQKAPASSIVAAIARNVGTDNWMLAEVLSAADS